MMIRRSPVRSVLAERKLFANGGMLPISIPMQNNPAAGILSSSTPLIEAVTQDATNPMGGGTLSMSEGGAAVGFVGHTQNDPGRNDLRNESEIFFNQRLPELDWSAMVDLPTTDRYNLIFPPPSPIPQRPPLGLGDFPPETSLFDDKTPTHLEKWVVLPARVSETVTASLKGLGKYFGDEIAERVRAAYDYMLERTGDTALGWEKIRALNTMITRQPEYAFELGQISDALMAKEEGQQMDANEFRLAVAEAFYNRRLSETPDVGGAGTDSDLTPTPAERLIEAGGQGPLGFTPADVDAAAAAAADVDAAAEAGGEEDITTGSRHRHEALDPPLRRREGEPTDLGEIVEEHQDTQGPLGFTSADVDDAADAREVAGGEVAADAREVAGGEVAADADAAADVTDIEARRRAILDSASQDDPEATTSALIQKHMEDFKSAVPEYEGMTEYEQGMALIKMAMAIAAGQSPRAIENIANGVLATMGDFTDDEKAKRDYERQVGFSAAKYGLDAVRNDLVQEREDARQIEWFYDGSQATGDNPHGPLVPVSMADVLSGDVDMTGLVHPNIVEKKISVLGEIRAASIKALADELKARTITPTEGEKIEQRFNNATELFETSTAGVKAFRSVIQKLVENPDDYLGGTAEVKSLWGKAMVFAGVDPGKKWLNRKAMEADMKIGFQKLIIGALKGVQSANSISNRDVSFLADAYIDAGFLTPDGKGGFTFSTDLATQRPEILVQRLQAGIEIFRDGQQKALNAFDMNVTILQKANAKGRYGPETYRGQIETLMPYAEVARMERAKDLGTVEYATAIEERPFYYEFDPDAGYKRLKGKEGSPFAGQFFSPTDENWAKFEGG